MCVISRLLPSLFGVRALSGAGYTADYALGADVVPAVLAAMALLALPSLAVSAAIASRVRPSIDGRTLRAGEA